MAWLGSIATTVLRNIVFSETPSNVVLEINNSDYYKRNVLCRDDGIVLYTRNNPEDKYEIILHKPYTETLHQCFSLFRSNNLKEAEDRFAIYKDKISILTQCQKISNVSKIQKLCDLLFEHPGWNVAHISAHLLLLDAFSHNVIKQYINQSDEHTGISPLQVAIQTNNLDMVKMLISAGSSLKHLDLESNTVYHYAANTTSDIITALKTENVDIVNNKNSSGYTALDIACQNNNIECVKILIQISPNINTLSSQDQQISPFGTFLHNCHSIEIMNLLIEKNLNIDALNFNGQTALHVMVTRKLFECISTLLCHMANVNIADNQGNTPLHLAVIESSPEIVQLLIAFGADVNKKNNKSESPRHLASGIDENSYRILYFLHAVGSERCIFSMSNCHQGCKHGEEFNGIKPAEPLTGETRTVLDQMLYVSGMAKMATMPRKQGKGGRLLCLDGGGIKGLVLIQMLMEIEAVLQKPIISCFDWIAGTSTGGILALGLITGKSLKECQALYFRIKNEAFVGNRPYSSEPLENALKSCFGEMTMMSDIRYPKLIITGVLADRRPVDLHLFRNYDSPSRILKIPCNTKFKKIFPPEEQFMWKVARVTGAAPSYFQAFDGRFLDGGLIANNPTLDAMTEIHEYNLAQEVIQNYNEISPLSIVVSLGTGLIPVTEQNIDLYQPTIIKVWSKLINLVNLVVDLVTSTDGRVVDRARTWCSMIGVPYFRFNPQLLAEVAINEKSDLQLAEMMWTAKAFMYANRDQIVELAAVLESLSVENSKTSSL